MLAMHVQTSVYRQMHQPNALSRIDMNSDRVPSVAERTCTEPWLCASDATSDTADTVLLPRTQDGEDLSEHYSLLGPSPNPTGTHWLLSTALMTSDMFGLGALSLPADFARLGWLPALGCLAWFTLTNVYSGVIYQRLTLKVPRAVVFDEIGAAAYGTAGRAMVFGSVYLTILLEPVIFHLMCMEALRQTLYTYDFNWGEASIAILVIMLPLVQLHNIEEVAWVSILGSVGMLLAMVVVSCKLLIMYFSQTKPASTQLVANSGFEVALVGVMDIAFAFGGQQNWMRWITTMKQRNMFAAAVTITTSLMTAVYLVAAAAGYAALGDQVDLHRPVSSVLGNDMWTPVMNAGILIHCIIAYQVITNVWCSTVLHLLLPRSAKQHLQARAWTHNVVWFWMTLTCMSAAATVAYALPFFSIIMAVIASFGDVMSMFGLPCLFAMKLVRLPRWERGICGLLVTVSLALSGVGVVTSVRQLVQASSTVKQ